MLVKILKTNPLVHFFTNTFLLLNFYYKRGKNNRISGWLVGILIKTTVIIKGSDNSIIIGRGFKSKGLRIYISGNRNKISIGADCHIDDSEIWITGDDNNVVLAGGVIVNNTEIGLSNRDSGVFVGKNTKIGGYLQLGTRRSRTESIRIFAFEGKKITMETDVAVSDGVVMRTSDSHSIYNDKKERINYAGDILIRSGCWICSGVTLLKGSGIGKGCVVGLGSLVTKDFSDEDNVIVVGSPARVVQENISWSLEI